MTEEQRDNLLLSMSNKIDKLEASQKEIKTRLSENTAELAQQKENMSKMETRLVEKIDSNTVELVRQRENIAHLEFTLMDKISALFDAREVSSDKFKDHKKKFESIEKVLDNHNARILRLENSRN